MEDHTHVICIYTYTRVHMHIIHLVYMCVCEVQRRDIRNAGSVLGLGRSRGAGHGNPLEWSCLENPHGQRSRAGYGPWGPTESDTTEVVEHARLLTVSFPGRSAGKESTCNDGDLGSILGLGNSPGGGNNYPFQYSGLENSMDRDPGRLWSMGQQRVGCSWMTFTLFNLPVLCLLAQLALFHLYSTLKR